MFMTWSSMTVWSLNIGQASRMKSSGRPETSLWTSEADGTIVELADLDDAVKVLHSSLAAALLENSAVA